MLCHSSEDSARRVATHSVVNLSPIGVIRRNNSLRNAFWIALVLGPVLSIAAQTQHSTSEISATSSGGSEVSSPSRAPAPPLESPAADSSSTIAAGESLFIGITRFANGGPPCAACHTVARLPFPSGGTMGPDLTHEYSKVGLTGLQGSLQTLFFPTMTPLFGNRPLTTEEQGRLLAFLKDADNGSAAGANLAIGFSVAAVLGCVVLLAVTWVLGRKRGEVTRYADWWIPVHAGMDAAFWMGVNHVILKEFHSQRNVPYFTDYLKRYSRQLVSRGAPEDRRRLCAGAVLTRESDLPL